MRLFNNEFIKVINNRPYWFAITFYMIFCVLSLFRVLVVDARTDLVGSLNDIMGLSILVAMLMAFIVTNNTGLDFRYKSIKFEIISGLTRTEKFVSNLLTVVFQALVLTLFLFVIAQTYYLIVNGQLVLFQLPVLHFFLKYFLWNFVFALFVNTVVLITKHGTGAFFIVFVYCLLEVLLVEANLLRLEQETLDKLDAYLLLGCIFELLSSDIASLASAEVMAPPLLYCILFVAISFARIRTMQIN